MTYDLLKINKLVEQDPMGLITLAEEEYTAKINGVVGQIKEAGVSVVLLCGPTSSGKTTTAERIAQGLGKGTSAVSTDDFFHPKNKINDVFDSKPDFDSIKAMDLEYMNNCVNTLIKSGKSEFPVFDFESGGTIIEKRTITLHDGGFIIIEGIHALSDEIIEMVNNAKRKNYIGIFIDFGSFYSYGGKVITGGREMRLIRRLVRDKNFRNSDAENTFNLWKNVVKNEDASLLPSAKRAHMRLNTGGFTDGGILKNQALNVLGEIKTSSEYFKYAEHLINIIKNFEPIDNRLLPTNSLLTEFVKN